MSPVLSILVPFYRDDPSALVAALAQQAGALTAGAVELVLYDDGSADPALTAQVEGALQAWPGPARLIDGERNRGRAQARNALAEAAGAASLLFLDADMAPADGAFLPRWLEEARKGTPVCFGGLEAPERYTPAGALHHALFAGNDCKDAAARSRNPAQYVSTANLLVSREAFAAVPFDAEFAGWGWEDCEWAARAAKRYGVVHIDNPAVHLGLESADSLLRRFRDSAANYARFVAAHPDLAATLDSHRWARRLQRARWARTMRPLLAALARGRMPAPMALRVAALKLWRASWYSEAL